MEYFVEYKYIEKYSVFNTSQISCDRKHILDSPKEGQGQVEKEIEGKYYIWTET